MTTDKIVLEVMEDLNKRSEIGLKKYGVGLDRTDLSLKDFLIHQYEELLDAALYCKRAIKELGEFEMPEKSFSETIGKSPMWDLEESKSVETDTINWTWKYKIPDPLPDWLITALHPKERLNVNDLLQTNQDDEEYYPDQPI